ncbi:MAG TPA: histidine phosphatase family protein [Stellaceae bacterium]|nr:histidine phosphatase family protein [Stellaceae bacterium]
MTVFHLLRHGEHVLAGRVLAGRTPGVGLSQRGRGEIARVAERLAGDGVAALYASPLERTRETAEIVAARLALPVTYREDLIELDFGEWTGLTFDAVRRDERWQAWNRQRGIATLPGGESMRAVQHRVAGALLELHASHPQQSVLLVSHGDVIRAALLFALGMPLDFYGRIEIGIASLSTIRVDEGGMRVLRLNELPRLSSETV